MSSFAQLIASRRHWIEEVLEPWCRGASRRDLLLAEQEWTDIAGRPAPEMTLWPWAWSRFPELVIAEVGQINETRPVRVRVRGDWRLGVPDARKSLKGELVLVNPAGQALPAISLDEIESVEGLDWDDFHK